jgi:Pyruvate/2-oxoacid:ferredoxin oxidoreductase gamma subunit
VLSGLYAAQRNDYPVTVKSGHSVSDVILSPNPIGYTGILRPQLMIVLFKEGLARVRAQLAEVSEEDTLVINQDLLPVETKAQVIALDFRKAGGGASKKESWAVVALAATLTKLSFYPLEAFKEAVGARSEFAAENLAAIEAGVGLLS